MTSVRASWMTWLNMSVTTPRVPSEPSSVVIVALRAVRRARSAPNVVGASGAEQKVDLAAALAQPVREREQRRGALPGADQQAARRIARDRKRAAERAGRVQHVPAAQLGQPASTGLGGGEDELHRAAVVGAHVVDSEGPAQEH